eukprot:CAMPEP_0181320908 /NCGR_PEP_ID=MMETSP1101-20121128/18382_1 /TAXON_ID=46948 /ORGANISM="Rhodomonas abbreviata, Strain Caron Lab Isolate" /LENGTH=87 /DNA_ID=CAMNT_0023428659 /DNA_START=3712 /DNA_END=3975 /DNA_ORIENTATION=+
MDLNEWIVTASGMMVARPGLEGDPECECRVCFAHVSRVRLRAVPCGHMQILCPPCAARRRFPAPCLVCHRVAASSVLCGTNVPDAPP